jgi:hypothetical protein
MKPSRAFTAGFVLLAGGVLGAGGGASAALAAAKPPLKVAVSPATITAGSGGHVLTFKVTATGAFTGQVSVAVPAGWTAPQASKATSAGYLAVHKLTCASAARSGAVAKRVIVVNARCGKGKDFSVSFGGTAAASMVTAPTIAAPSAFTTEARIGKAAWEKLAVQSAVTVKPGPLFQIAVSGGGIVQAPGGFWRDNMDVHEGDPGTLPGAGAFTAQGQDKYGNSVGDLTATAQWSVSPGGPSLCAYAAPSELCAAGTVGDNEVNATVGDVTGDYGLTGQFTTPVYTCEGDNYDVDNNPADGYEISQPLDAHTMGTASAQGMVGSCDTPLQTITGVLPSDQRVHELPAVSGFNDATGSAPLWYSISATGGITCADDIGLTLTVTNAAYPNCYQVSVITNAGTYMAQTNMLGTATITEGQGAYTDRSTVYIKVQKACLASDRYNPSFTISYHL